MVDKYSYGYGAELVNVSLTDAQVESLKELYAETKKNIDALPAGVGLAVPLYEMLLSFLPKPSASGGTTGMAAEYMKTYTWIEGAQYVNAGVGAFATYIRNYTDIQYRIRFGKDDSGAARNALSRASNQIGLNLVSSILENGGKIPSVEGVGAVDAGAAASLVFKSNSYPQGDYTGWAGTILFSFLGYDRFYREWLLSDDVVVADFYNGVGVESRLVKTSAGTYDLFAAVNANVETIDSLGLMGQLSAALQSVGSIDRSQEDLIEDTNTYIAQYYQLPGSMPFLLGNRMLYSFSRYQATSLDVRAGTVGNDGLEHFWVGETVKARSVAIHAGDGSDQVLGFRSTVINSAREDALLDGGTGADLLTYAVDRNRKDLAHPYKLDIYLQGINSEQNTWRFLVEKKNATNNAVKGRDYAYGFEFLDATNNSDVLSVSKLPELRNLSPESGRLFIDLKRSDTGDGDTLNLSASTAAINMKVAGSGVSILENRVVVRGVENILGTVYDDVLIGDGGNNILAGGPGTNILTGGLGNDKFMVDLDTTIIKDADKNDRLYLGLSGDSPLASQWVQLEGGFVFSTAYSQAVGSENTLTKGMVAYLYPMSLDLEDWQLGYLPELGRYDTVLDGSLGDEFLVRYSLVDTTLKIDVSYSTGENTHVLVENYESGDLGLKFLTMARPDSANSPVAMFGTPQDQINNYMDGHAKMLDQRFTLATDVSAWHA